MKNCNYIVLILSLCITLLVSCSSVEESADATTQATPPPVVEESVAEEPEPEESVLEEFVVEELEVELPLEEEPVEELPLTEGETEEKPQLLFGTVYMTTFVGVSAYDVLVTNPNAVGTEECEVLLRELFTGMEELTNWNLDVADIYMGKGGVTVTFGEDSVLIIGLTEDQVDEFFVFDQYSLLEFALGSIETTVQMALTGEGGDPLALDVYFSTHDDQPLGFVEEGIIVPIDQPYNGLQSQS